jgi:hypothetical protein
VSLRELAAERRRRPMAQGERRLGLLDVRLAGLATVLIPAR